jgi:4-azaleucine resistance transporter AzlC
MTTSDGSTGTSGTFSAQGGGITFTRQGVRHGFIVAQPMAASVALYGAVFGVLAGEGGLSSLQALLMSALVYSGSAQLASLQIGITTSLLAPLLLAVVLLNARYLLYGAALRPWLAGTSPLQAYSTLFFIGDGSWALSMKEYANGNRDAGFVFGSSVAMYLPWTLGTATGHLLASWIPDPRALGLDFMLVAFAAAIGVGAWRGKGDVWPALAAALAAVLVYRLLPSGWHIVAAGLAGAAVGAWRHADA